MSAVLPSTAISKSSKITCQYLIKYLPFPARRAAIKANCVLVEGWRVKGVVLNLNTGKTLVT